MDHYTDRGLQSAARGLEELFTLSYTKTYYGFHLGSCLFSKSGILEQARMPNIENRQEHFSNTYNRREYVMWLEETALQFKWCARRPYDNLVYLASNELDQMGLFTFLHNASK